MIGRTSAEAVRCLKAANFKVFDLVGGVMLAIAPQKPTILQGRQVVFVSWLSPALKKLKQLTSPRLRDLPHLRLSLKNYNFISAQLWDGT